MSDVEDNNIENILIKDITPFTLGIALFSPEASLFITLLQFLENLEKIGPKDHNKDKNNIKIFSQVDGKLMSGIIEKGSPIPFDNTHQYHTLNDFQEEVEIEVYEGKTLFVKDNHLLGKFRIKNLPKKKLKKLNLM